MELLRARQYFSGLLKLMSLFVWIIEVEGNKTVSASEITAACEEIGIYAGMNKKPILKRGSKPAF